MRASNAARSLEQPDGAEAEAYVPLFSIDTEIGLDGFPGGI